MQTLEGFGKARPVDEATRNASLAAARDTLLAIARRRDSAALAAHLSPTIKFSFGDSEGGPAGFFAHWHKYRSMDSLWATMVDVLEHGGRMRGADSFTAPWTFTALPDSLDGFEYATVRDSNVVVRATRSASGEALGTLTYDIVRVRAPASAGMREVGLRDGRKGFVDANAIRGPVEYRIGLRRSGTRWVIDFFVAGD